MAVAAAVDPCTNSRIEFWEFWGFVSGYASILAGDIIILFYFVTLFFACFSDKYAHHYARSEILICKLSIN